MKKLMAERILKAELTDHLGYEKHAPDGRNRGNSRNDKTTKTLKDDRGALPVEIPPGPRGLLRSQADPQVPDALVRLRRQDHLHVRTGHEHARYPGPRGRPLRGGHLARTILPDHRHGNRRGPFLAVAVRGCGLIDPVPGCHVRQEP